MAERRMFSKVVIDNDQFLDMPATAQLLYFHLGMYTDDEGFVGSPRKIQRSIGCNDDDMKILITKGFVIPFQSGVIVITHWYIHNTLRKDRAKVTVFKDERQRLIISENGTYHLACDELATECQPVDNQLTTKCPPNIREDNIRENNIGEGNEPNASSLPPKSPKTKPACHSYGEYKHVKLTDEQYNKLIADFGENKVKDYIKRCDEYCQQHGKSYRDYYLTIRNWIKRDSDNQPKGGSEREYLDILEVLNDGQ